MLFVQLTTILRQKEQAAEESRNNYILTLEKTNADRHQHYNSTMPAVFTVRLNCWLVKGHQCYWLIGKGWMTQILFLMQELQNMNGNRITEYKRIISVFSESQRKVLPVVNTCLDNITAASDAMNPDQVMNPDP